MYYGFLYFKLLWITVITLVLGKLVLYIFAVIIVLLVIISKWCNNYEYCFVMITYCLHKNMSSPNDKMKPKFLCSKPQVWLFAVSKCNIFIQQYEKLLHVVMLDNHKRQIVIH